MKKLIITVVTILVLMGSFTSNAQEQPVYTGTSIPFELNIIGTRYYADISSLVTGLRRSPSVRSLIPSSESQNNVLYTGNYLGTPEALASDISGLAADRFGLESRQEKDGKLLFTLKKSAPIAPAPLNSNPYPQEISSE